MVELDLNAGESLAAWLQLSVDIKKPVAHGGVNKCEKRICFILVLLDSKGEDSKLAQMRFEELLSLPLGHSMLKVSNHDLHNARRLKDKVECASLV